MTKYIQNLSGGYSSYALAETGCHPRQSSYILWNALVFENNLPGRTVTNIGAMGALRERGRERASHVTTWRRKVG